MNDLTFARFDVKVGNRIAELEAGIDGRINALEARFNGLEARIGCSSAVRA